MTEAARDLSTLFQSGTAVGLTDGEVLRRAARATDDEAAAFFRMIVERHGPMVLRVCRGELGNAHDAEDAFQATFLVLARRLREASRPESVGGWLYGVARRVSSRARADAARRRSRDRAAVRLAVVGDEPSDADHDVAVQEEVGRLPARYREIVILCFWEGLTQEQAASRLGCPIGTVRSRSARARDLLRRRLARRGLASEGFAAPSPAVPVWLIAAAMKGTAEVVAGRLGLGTVGVRALELSIFVSRRMIMSRVITVGSWAMLATLALVGIGVAGMSPPKEEAAAKAGAAKGEARAVGPTLGEYIIEPSDILLIEVLDVLEGRPLNGERVVRSDGKISLGYYGDVYVAGLSLSEAKEKVVLQLQKFLKDELLGLIDVDPKTGGEIPVAPKDSDRVVVDVVAVNTKFYYLVGSFNAPGRVPATGSETILDAVTLAGGLADDADANHLVLVRESPRPGQARTEAIDFEAILMGEPDVVDHFLQPDDRLIARRRAGVDSEPRDLPRQPVPLVRPERPRTPKPRDTLHQPTPYELQLNLRSISERLNRVLKKLEE